MASRRERKGDSMRTSIIVGLVVGTVSGILAAVPGSFVINWVEQNPAFNPYPFHAYHYSAPRPACGNNTDGWQVVQGGAVCSENRTVLIISQAPALAQAIFVDQRPFPADYQVTVTISDVSADSCAGTLLRGNQAQTTGYAFFICSTGVWEIVRYQPTDTQLGTLTGSLPVTSQSTYTLKVTTHGQHYQFFINDKLTQSFADGLFLGTENINLMLSPSGAAGFADFAIDELHT